MADYFVKTAADGGNDGNSGATWALAKATPQAGINLCTSAGDRCVIAPGRYSISSGLTPATAGAGSSGNNKTIQGDYDSTITDGGAATSGVTAGYIKIDISTSGNQENTVDVLAAHNSWAYWNLKYIWFCGGKAVALGASSNTATDGNIIDGCIFESLEYIGLAIYNWSVDIAGAKPPITVKNCIINGGSPAADYSGGGIYTFFNKTTDFPASPQMVIDRCIIVGGTSAVFIDAQSSSLYSYIKTRNCTLRTKASTGGFMFWGYSASYAKADSDDCLMVGGNYSFQLVAGSTKTRAMEYYSNASGSTTKGTPTLPPVPYLYPGSSDVINGNASNGVFPDIWGTATQGDADYGAQEYVTGQYPLEPNMDISNLTTVTPGPSTGGGLSRGRVVNAGGI